MGFLDSISKEAMGAIGSLGSAAIGGGLSYLGQSSANQVNQAMASEQMAFQERMANTTYQRAVKDLEAAGLNKYMAYGNLAGSNPSGALGVAQQNAFQGLGEGISQAGSRYSEITKRAAEMDNLQESNKQIQATTAATVAAENKTKQDEKTSAAAELSNLGQLAVQKSQIQANAASAARDAAQAQSIIDDNAKKAMMSNVYDIGEKVTGWAKEKIQKLHSAKDFLYNGKNITIEGK